ncbi:hypothetical protein N657DRAFT_484591 [Parathielavia appendiculata]|uniref:Uncharacterized protein n=1 Tax=Parathielavia appendiculata TaxID=2587402 RepID=A0AAN6TY47_9PEZI|nr:hypothetical protein N657DRAFT_484591 [Parathielavia appendiculata]
MFGGCRHVAGPPLSYTTTWQIRIWHAYSSLSLLACFALFVVRAAGRGDSTVVRAPRSSRCFACPEERCSLAMLSASGDRVTDIIHVRSGVTRL